MNISTFKCFIQNLDQTLYLLIVHTHTHVHTHRYKQNAYIFEGCIIATEQSGIPRVYLKQVREHHEILSCLANPALESRCIHGIDEYEIWTINYKKMLGFSPFLFVIVVSIHPMLLYMCCRCPCTLTSFLGYVNRFCMIANSHFCKSYVIMIFSWKCLEETLLIGNLFSKVSICWWEALSFWVLFSASWQSECSYCRNYLSSVLIQELFLTWDHDDLSLRAKASFQ